MKYGLIGGSLKHSYSKFIHAKLGDYAYDLYPLREDALEDFVTGRSLAGYNVTIPYKKDVIKYLDAVDERALAIGAVNTVVEKNGMLYGYNTDFDGMAYMLKRAGIDIKDKTVMVLGTGGTSQTAQAVLQSLGAKTVYVVSRTGDLNYANCYERRDVQVIINTTPVGTYPDVTACPIDVSRFASLEGVADVVYNPETTRLVWDARRRGVKATSGLPMLVAQAVYAKALFLGEEVDEAIIEDVVRDRIRDARNVVLIGMPGAGKSTVGKEVAKILGKTYVDIDQEIERREGVTIPEIFATKGEEYFRTVEKAVTLDYAKTTGAVIATGGGVVKDDQNNHVLHLNGVVVEIFRPLDTLATQGRPLSKDQETVKRLYEERKAKYQAFRDGIVYNTSIDQAVKGVIEIYENSCH